MTAVMDKLERGPLKGLRRWPAMMVEIKAGNVIARTTKHDAWWMYELSPRARRRRARSK